MTYNITEIDNNTGLDQFLGNINIAANGLPGVVIILILWVGTYVYASNRNLDPGESFTASSFLSMLVSGIMYFTGIATLPVTILTAVMFFGGVVYLMFK